MGEPRLIKALKLTGRRRFAQRAVASWRSAGEDAWRRVEQSKAPWASENYSTAGRTILTQHIIKMARDGERDPRWLADSALLYLSQQKLTSTPGRRSLIELVNYARLDWLTLFVQNYCGRETLRGTNLSPSDFGLSVPRCCTGVFMLQRSYFWHQAQVCMSLARVTDDPVLKERYEDLAINFVRNADRERDHDGKQTSYAEPHKGN